MKKHHLIIIAVILIIVVGIVCFGLGFVTGKKSLEPTVAQYKKIIDYYMPAPKEIFSISGKITEIKDNVLSLETVVQNPYILPDEWETKIIKVIISDETEITKFDMKNMKNIEISLSDLEINHQISVSTEENIKDKTEFEAKSIQLITVPAIPTL